MKTSTPNFVKGLDFKKNLYYFKKDGNLRKLRKGRNASGNPYKATKLKNRIPGGWQSGYFYTVNGKGSLITSLMAPSYQ
jgi:hypothetical protein